MRVGIQVNFSGFSTKNNGGKMKKFLVFTILILVFGVFSFGQNKAKAVEYTEYNTTIDVFKIHDGKKKELIASKVIHIYSHSGTKFINRTINLKNDLKLIIKADINELLKLEVFKKKELIVSINKKPNVDFSFQFESLKNKYKVEIFDKKWETGWVERTPMIYPEKKKKTIK
jgi:hypothetical protein